MRIVADLHTHTMVSHHALSTLDEIMAAAKNAGLKAVAITNHAPGLPDSAHPWHFRMLENLPDKIHGVRLIRGAEVNIMDPDATLDMSDRDMARMEFIIASMHLPVFMPRTAEDHTDIWVKLARHPRVDCLGHLGQKEYPFDYGAVVTACRDTDTLIEINNNSFSARPGSEVRCKAIAACCAELGAFVVVASDAHWAGHVGCVDKALEILREIDFPEALILNADFDRLAGWFKRKRGVSLCTSE